MMRQLVLFALLVTAPACSDGGEPATAEPAFAGDIASADVAAPGAAAEAAPAATAQAVSAAPPGWREEAEMRGVQYAGRVPADGSGLYVGGWRNDGGFYISDELHSVSIYSAEGRVALSAEAFRHREPDGVAAWTIADFWSYAADPAEAGLGLFCGYGPDSADWNSDNTRYVVGIVRWPDAPPGVEIHHEGVIAAVEANLVTGEITPVATDDVWCRQELL